MLFGVIKNSEGLFSLFAEFLRGEVENRVGDASLTHSERDREVRDFNVILLASAIARRRHLVIDTHRTYSWSHATSMPLHP